MYYMDANGTQPNRIFLKRVNYDKNSKQFLLDSYGQFFQLPIARTHVVSLFDDNLNIVKSNYFTSEMDGTYSEDIKLSDDNILTISERSLDNQNNAFPALSYASFNNSLELITQKKIQLSTLGFAASSFTASIAYKKNGILNFQLGSQIGNGCIGCPLFLFDHSAFYKGISNCLGKDTVLFTKSNIYALPVSGVSFSESAGVPLQVTNMYIPQPPVEFPMIKTEICKEISICDTIKLFGTPYHCLSNPLDSFKIIRNPLCRRKTNWQVDTTAIKIISQTDTTLQVKYLQAYRGSIKVGFGGCSLTDSMAIEVYAPKTAVSLGKDTMLCPGKTITLYAGAGFTNYQWQDGSTADSLVIAQTGNYIITATDSCGNVFKDTITVTPLDVALNVDYPPGLCLNDTAVFNLPAPLYNFTWQPNTASLLTNNLWKLYPTVTTVYSISAEREPGCILSDTVLITIKNCPDYIYFPNAFTPNKDGLNDVYKPTVSGRIIVYEFSIYNRYGQPVFKSTTPNQGWNGNFNNSQKPLPGGYVWHCRYQFINQPVVQKKGMFILIR